MTALPLTPNLHEIVDVLTRMCESCAWKTRALKAEASLLAGAAANAEFNVAIAGFTERLLRSSLGVPARLLHSNHEPFVLAASRTALDIMERKLYGARRAKNVLENEVLATQEGQKAYDRYCAQLGQQAQTVLAADRAQA